MRYWSRDKMETPCIRCQRTGRPIGKVTPYGVVCNSCSVHFREEKPCQLCGRHSKRLTRVARFGDGLKVCPRCATRDYKTCFQCHKYRMVAHEWNSHPYCKLCFQSPWKSCMTCYSFMPSGQGKVCSYCYWKSLFFKRLSINDDSYSNPITVALFQSYGEWLVQHCGIRKAAITLNKYTEFFSAVDLQSSLDISNYGQLVRIFKPAGLRKYQLVIQWLVETHDLTVDTVLKEQLSAQEQIFRLMNCDKLWPNQRDILNRYYNKLVEKLSLGKTSWRSIRLALTPGVGLLMACQKQYRHFPIQADVDAYLNNVAGQGAAIYGFVKFLCNEFSINLKVKKITKSLPHKEILERKLLARLHLQQDIFNVVLWAKLGLQYFYKFSARHCTKVVESNIFKSDDGIWVYLEQRFYWLPLPLISYKELG